MHQHNMPLSALHVDLWECGGFEELATVLSPPLRCPPKFNKLKVIQFVTKVEYIRCCSFQVFAWIQLRDHHRSRWGYLRPLPTFVTSERSPTVLGVLKLNRSLRVASSGEVFRDFSIPNVPASEDVDVTVHKPYQYELRDRTNGETRVSWPRG
ncbi:uncharacterized protein EI90DRAFT_830303 [Cantharellus anzutake]|uniref:uncharacterized protein n=1 Tax=Cantharellus anzutake TaxID=1750568 RepID=UPI0019078C66|nr:uncharacterized protein EI90DRAFT_830303 [Cantharellus anzutake]KAF8343114.1 hypothetical protein EI90DRAFT_830303 [Cantharellus anzutake]